MDHEDLGVDFGGLVVHQVKLPKNLSLPQRDLERGVAQLFERQGVSCYGGDKLMTTRGSTFSDGGL